MTLMTETSSFQKVGPSFSNVALPACAIVAAGILVYSNSFGGPFVLDDIGAIVQNKSIQDLSKVGTVLTGATHATVIGRPLLNLSLAVNYWLAGSEGVWDYHAVNLAAHLVAAILLFAVVHRTLLLPVMAGRTQRDATGLAFAVSLIWAVHPLQTESVTYIVQRAESLVAVFYFLTLYCVIRGATGTRPTAWYVTAIAACTCGMTTKEVMVTAPVVILFYDRVFLEQSFAEIRRKRAALYFGLAATWIWLAVLMRSSKDRSGTAGFGLGLGAWNYAMTQFGFIVRYLRLSFWPNPLVFDYGNPIAVTSMEILPFATTVFCLLIAAVVALRYRPWIGFLGLSFFIILAPTSSVVPLVTQTAAEHRMYLPLASLVALVVLLVHQLLDWVAARGTVSSGVVPATSRVLHWVTLIFVATGLGYITYQRNLDYQSELTLWRKTALDFPSNARAYHAIGCEYLKAGQASRALQEFNHAIELSPDVIPLIYNRGNAYVAIGQLEEAIADYRRVVALSPIGSVDQAQAYYQMGNALGSLGKHEEALECFVLALRAQPGYVDAQKMIEKVRRHLGRHQENPDK